LAVHSPSKSGFGEKALVDFALLPQCDFRFEDVYFTGQMLRNFSGEPFSPGRVRDLHRSIASIATRPGSRPGGTGDSPTLQQTGHSCAYFDVILNVRSPAFENKKPTAGLFTEVGCLRFDQSLLYRASPPHNGALLQQQQMQAPTLIL
jgi:hypothetical protein